MKLLGPNHVKADNFEIEIIHRGTVVYRENEMEVSFEREAGYDPEHYTAVYLSMANEWNVPPGKKIDENQRSQMVINFNKAFKLMGTRLKIE
ncbi:MAG: hypothetical protein V4725_14700 [Bacteroidota bacterium]